LDADELLRRLVCAEVINSGELAGSAKSEAEQVAAAEEVLKVFTTKIYGGWSTEAGAAAKQTICDLAVSQV
jgi:hypothetical protein